MEILYTKDLEWLKKWDAYVLRENKASHLLLSEWNKSFQSYGFDYEICICHENGVIHGGFSGVIAKALFFKFYIVPYGPIVSGGFENCLDILVTTVVERAKCHNCCYCHITLPVSETKNAHVFNALPELPALINAKEGHLFKYVYSSNGLNWVDLSDHNNEEELLESFRPSVRRYIRSSQRKELEARFLESETDIKMGYELCLENARNHHYTLRDWDSFKDTLINMVSDKSAVFLGAFKDENLKGAALVIKSGNYNTYILGGTKKEKPDLLVGHFLHWEAIKISFRQKLSGYNADVQVMFINSKYHWILKPAFFKTYLFVEKQLKPHKKTLSKILSMLKRK